MSVIRTRSHVRFKVLAMTVLLAAITYLDRVCISTTGPLMAADLGLSDLQLGFVFSAFTLAYGLFEIPAGWWGDRVGTRRVLTRIVAWWSTFTIATAGAFSYTSLLITRFLFGAGEAGAWPNAARTLSRWFPNSERGTAQGVFFMGAHLAGGLTPLLVTVMLEQLHLSWRMVFVLFGCVGFLWVIVWRTWFRDEPADHPEVSQEELQWIEQGRLVSKDGQSHSFSDMLAFLKNGNVLLLCAMYFTQTYGFVFYITWLPTYLKRNHGFSSFTLSLLAGLPLILSVFADLFGGITTDQVTKRWGIRMGRVGVGAISLFCAGASMIFAAQTENPLAAAILLSLAAAASNFLLGAAWSSCTDIGGSHAGVVSAAMNTAGQVGGFLSPILLALILKYYPERWDLALFLTGGLYLFGGFCWCFVNPSQWSQGEPLKQDNEELLG